MENLFSIEGKTALVTGGSSGIGEMIAEGFVKAGARVYIASRKADVCEEVAERLSNAGTCIAVGGVDLAKEEGAIALADAMKAREEKLDILVNNAGATWGAPFLEYPDHAWDRVMDLNVRGVFNLTRELFPLLKAAASDEDPARMIAISSVAAFGAGNVFAYGASKAAVNQLTRALAAEFAEHRITCNAIAPGPFPSRMMAFRLNDPKAKAAIEGANPLGRVGTPEDAAGLAIFLSSRAGAYVNGTVIPLDGGALLGRGGFM